MIQKLNFQKQLATELLSKFRVIDPFAMIAGGAPRDWDFGQLANDLDVYLRMPNHSTLSLVELVCENFGITSLKQLVSNMSEAYAKLPNLKWVFEGYYEQQKVNVMVMEQGVREEIVSNFDVSLCECWFDGQNIHKTKNYNLTKEHNICFINKNYTGKETHIKKMMQRFPNIRFVKEFKMGE